MSNFFRLFQEKFTLLHGDLVNKSLALNEKKKKSISIIVFTKYSRLGASSRLRIMQYQMAMKDHGINLTIRPLLDDFYCRQIYAAKSVPTGYIIRRYVKRMLNLFLIKKYDLVWIEKELFPYIPGFFEKILKWTKVPTIFDYDDAIYLNYEGSSRGRKFLKDKIRHIMKDASAVVCGNRHLANYARDAGQTNIIYAPTVVDPSRYKVKGPVIRDRIVIGWIGSPSTVKYLKIVAPILCKLSASYPISLLVVGASFTFPALDVQSLSWSEETEAELISSFDIGIMPLSESEWEHGKCGYKIIQYMVAGVPPVATKIGANEIIISHGVDGFLADSESHWEDYLKKLIINREFRIEMGLRGRKKVEQLYSIKSNVKHLSALIKDLTEEKRGSSFRHAT